MKAKKKAARLPQATPRKASSARTSLKPIDPPPYVRTAEDEALIDRVAHGNKPVKVKGRKLDDGVIAISPDHPDLTVGSCRLMEAFGVTDVLVLDGLLQQLTELATTGDQVDYAKLNSLIAYVGSIGPRDTIEAMHAVQMAAVHSAMMNTARIFKNSSQPSSTLEAFDSASQSLNKLTRTWSMQVETLKKHRSTGEQSIRVQHVHVAEGAQAIVGNGPMRVGGRGAASENGHRPHEPRAEETIVDEAGTPLLSYVEALGPALPSSGEARLERVPLSWGNGRRS